MKKKEIIKKLNEMHDAMIFTLEFTKNDTKNEDYNKGRYDARQADLWLLEAQLGNVLRDLLIMPKRK